MSITPSRRGVQNQRETCGRMWRRGRETYAERRRRARPLPTALLGGLTLLLAGAPGPALGQSCEWGPLGSGMNNTVLALAVFDDGTGPALYAGGYFTEAGGVQVNHIAKWDGTQWSPLGSGMNNTVLAL